MGQKTRVRVGPCRLRHTCIGQRHFLFVGRIFRLLDRQGPPGFQRTERWPRIPPLDSRGWRGMDPLQGRKGKKENDRVTVCGNPPDRPLRVIRGKPRNRMCGWRHIGRVELRRQMRGWIFRYVRVQTELSNPGPGNRPHKTKAIQLCTSRNWNF